MVIVANSAGEELRHLLYTEYDFDIAEETADFSISISIPEWVDIPEDARIYIPNTEYGGIFKRLVSDTRTATISVEGYTWRGMMRNKIIQPESGQNYASDVGDINTIIKERVEDAFGGLFTGSNPIGVIASYQYNRYCTLYDGLVSMLASVGYKLSLRYDQVTKRVIADAAPIMDYSNQIEFSSDMSANYHVAQDRCGVNHLICLGSGELSQRTVIHLYSDGKGNISQNQTFFGSDEIAQVYDYAGADATQLLDSGTQQLKSLQSGDDFSLDVEGAEFEIGDIVGGRDYVTGISMKAKVTGVLRKSVGGNVTTEYTISDVLEG